MNKDNFKKFSETSNFDIIVKKSETLQYLKD